MKLSQRIKLELYNQLSKEIGGIGNSEDGGIISFLNEIWDLTSMKSQDNRYNNALGEFVQHLVNNPDDYSYDYVFRERLNLLNDDESYAKFIETIVSPKYRTGEDDIFRSVLLINPYLEKDGYTLVLTEYDDIGNPIYKIEEVLNDGTPTDIKVNDIVFYVEKSPAGRNNWASSHEKPTTFPSFVLAFNAGWNDYSIESSFHLFYYKAKDEAAISIGPVKIIYCEEKITTDFLQENFTILDHNFCSLGQNDKYYFGIKENLSRDMLSVLYALRDVAFFPQIQDDFVAFSTFKSSLTRFDNAERLLREAPYKIYGYDLNNLYSFKYNFKPAYSENSIDIEFDFNSDSPLPNRIYALTGRNGTGKTQLITSLPKMIAHKKEDAFIPRAPLFSKIIAVSYSVFDRFDIPKKTSTFNYCYCGIRKENSDQFSEKELVIRFNDSCRLIETLGRINKWRKILKTFINEDLIDCFLIEKDEEEYDRPRNMYKADMKGFAQIKNKLSSGQAIILYIITEIVANIRYDSLLLYDEPETHLHPNAITQLMNTVYELVDEFQSYCIIATHSPLVVRELFSKNVYVIDREDSFISARRIPMESFGENLSVLTEEIFGNKGIPKQYKKILQNLVDNGYSYEEIVSLLEFDDIPLSLNARIFIKSIVNKQD